MLDDLNNFKDNNEVVLIASQLLIIAALFQISDSTQVVFLGALRGLQDVKIPTLITFVSYWVVGFPLCCYLGSEYMYASAGIWMGLLAGLTASSIFLYLRFDYLSKQFITKKKTA
jgi:MATE family multidrug resistance protein